MCSTIWSCCDEIDPVLSQKMNDSQLTQTSVTAVTERTAHLGDTPVVNMVRKARKKAFFEPGDTRQQWKGEAAASFVCMGSPVAEHYRPPVPATGPRYYLVNYKRLRREVILRGRFFCPCPLRPDPRTHIAVSPLAHHRDSLRHSRHRANAPAFCRASGHTTKTRKSANSFLEKAR